MNIAEILKKFPKGTKLYSPIYGKIELVDVEDNELYSITCVTQKGNYKTFTSEGKIFNDYTDSECVLFPSKDQRDWSKFGLTDHEAKHQFKPFDKVLVRDYNDNEWNCDFFSNMNEDGYYNCINSWWRQCIPYDGNEHLLGTANDPE